MSESVQSVVRAFTVLEHLAGQPGGVSDIAEGVDLPRSTVARLLATMSEVGAVCQVDDGSEYRIGPLVSRLATSAGPGQRLQSVAHQTLVDLVEELGEAAGLSVLDDTVACGEVVYLDQVMNDAEVQIKDWTGNRFEFHCVSAGLVMMAFAPSEVRLAALDRPLQVYTEQTVTDRQAVLDRLERVAASGLAWTVNELSDDVTSIAAPVWLDGEVVAAIHVHGPSYRFPGDQPVSKVESVVLAAAEQVSNLLNY